MSAKLKPVEDRHVKFKELLVARGGEILAPTNPYETMRFKTIHGVGVVYHNARGHETWNRAAQAARDHMLTPGTGALSPVKTFKRKSLGGRAQALRERDGDACFFCLRPLGDDVTIEHLVPISHGGPNHISNTVLAHEGCNLKAGHMSAPEKIRLREEALLAKVRP